MSQLQVTKITTVDNTTPLILATGNAGGGQIIVQSSNTDVFFNGNINFSNYVTGDGSGLFIPSSNVANMAFNTANAAFASANNVAPQVTPAFNTANVAFDTANAAFASANNVAPQVEPSFRTANAAFVHANAAYDAANNVGPQIAPTFNTANAAFAKANIASNTAIGAYNTANSSYDNANAAFNAANGKFSSSGGTISGAVEITADLTVHGNTRFIDQQTLSVGDPLIYLAANNYTSDVVDIGFVANYVNSTSANVHTGLYRSSGTKEYYLFYGYDKEPYNNYIDPTGNNIQQAVLNSTLRTSNLILGGANAINWIRSAYAQANAGGANVGQTAPTGVSSGKLWWNSDLGKLYVYYTDPANTSSWIETSPSAASIEASLITGYINPVYDATNAAYTTANVEYASINSNWTVTNTVYGVANAAFAAANNITPQIAPSYNTANAAFATANAAFAFTWDTTAKTSDFTALANTGYFVNTTSNQVVVNLPSTPAPGAKVTIVDYAGTAATYNIVLNVGSNKMNSYQANGAINTNRASLDLVYVDSTQGWVNYSSYIQTTSYQTYAIEYLIVAGGGGGGYNAGAGGGAGGMLSGSTTVTVGTGYSMVVGGGGSYNTGNGSNSTGLGLTAIGGGGGASNDSSGNSGGSGGGGATYSGGSGTSGQGNNGGNGDGQNGASRSGAGGGGKGAAGQNTPSSSQGGAGGAGAEWPSGSGTYYAGGGGGSPHGGSGGAGGTGGGGAGSSGGTSNGSDGTTNKGGGGGAGGGYGNNGKNGGSGIVIIRYAGSQRGSGGTVSSSGGYTYHTFNSSATYTA